MAIPTLIVESSAPHYFVSHPRSRSITAYLESATQAPINPQQKKQSFQRKIGPLEGEVTSVLISPSKVRILNGEMLIWDFKTLI
jgi:hypothetical protein